MLCLGKKLNEYMTNQSPSKSQVNRAYAKATLEGPWKPSPNFDSFGAEPLKFKIHQEREPKDFMPKGIHLEVTDSGAAYQWRRYIFNEDGMLLSRSAVTMHPPHSGTLDALDWHELDPDPTDKQVMMDLRALSDLRNKT
jgi:hypothetical protein